MARVLLEKDGRIARITLNRSEVMNAIDDDLLVEIAAADGFLIIFPVTD